MNTEKSARFRSLQWKLPLVSGALLLLVLLGFATAMYLEIRRATLATAETRLQTIVQRVSSDNRSSFFTTWRPFARSVGQAPEVQRFLRSGRGPVPARVVETLRSLRSQSAILAAIELRDLQGRVLTRSGELPTQLRDEDIVEAMARGDSLGAGVFRVVDSLVMIPLFYVLSDENADLGYVVFWRGQPTIATPVRSALTDYIGPEAVYLLGDTTQTLWTDYARVVPGPTVRMPVASNGSAPEVVRYYRGEAKFGVVSRVRGVPWLALVELPARVVLAPSNAFLGRLAGIAAGFVGLALLAVWWLSRRLTAPLGELAAAADAFNQGNRGRRVDVRRDDEIGTVATALNRMLDTTEQTLARRERLAMLGQLAGGVGHELRNPLGVMSNAIYFLEKTLGDRPASVTEYLRILRSQITLSDKIVGDLLDFARVRPPQTEPIFLPDLVFHQLERVGKREGVQVKVSIPGDLPSAMADRVQVGQVVLNLLSNAVEAMDRGGELRIAAHLNGGEKVILEVADTGPGIPPENLERIFEPLFTTKTRGMGLGLAVSRALALANGGDLRVRSIAGDGSTFMLVLPIAHPDHGRAP